MSARGIRRWWSTTRLSDPCPGQGYAPPTGSSLPRQRHRFSILLLSLVTLFAHGDRFPPMGRTLADTGSAHYRFETHDLASVDGARHYRIWIGVPKAPAPAAGHPVIYLLDGNAVMADLRDEWLAPLSGVD